MLLINVVQLAVETVGRYFLGERKRLAIHAFMAGTIWLCMQHIMGSIVVVKMVADPYRETSWNANDIFW
jgi:hypothetical protein